MNTSSKSRYVPPERSGFSDRVSGGGLLDSHGVNPTVVILAASGFLMRSLHWGNQELSHCLAKA